MKTLKNVFQTCAVAVLVAAAPAHGQIIEEEDDGYRQSSTADKFFGTASTVFVNGSSTSASYQALEVGYDTPFAGESGRAYFAGVATNTALELDLELTERARTEPENADSPREVTREVDESDFDVKDAFLQYGFSDNTLFTVGRRRVAWGQFDLVSPVNLALPITPQTAEPITGKINTMVPQDQVAISWFPSERVEVQGYYFPTTNIDWLVEDVLEEDDKDSVYYNAGSATNFTFSATLTDPDLHRRDETSDIQDFTDHDAFAARVLFNFNWGTLGFTYHDGHDSLVFDTPDLATLEILNNMGNVVNTNPTTNTEARAYNVRRHPDLHEAENFGIELAIPRGQWVFKFEVLHQETTASLNAQSQYFADVSATALTFPRSMADYNYIEAVLNRNKGQLYVPVDRRFIGIGADSDRDNWRFNFSLLNVSESYDGIGDELIELEKAAGWDTNRGESVTLPSINVARYIGGSDKQKEVGFVGGFLGAYAGASLYYKSNFRENFKWVAGIEATSNLRDQLVSDTEDPDNPNRETDDYELADDISTGFRVSLIYDF